MRDVLRLGESLVADEHEVYQPRSNLWKWWRHSRAADRRNIQHHYDVGNDFYALWLDRNRVYSCAYFKNQEDTLDAAQEKKLDHICRKLHAQARRALPGHRLRLGRPGPLGGAALRRQGARRHVERRSVRATPRGACASSVWATACEIRLQDYRDVPEDEPFDKIASVGMFEHVGKRNLPAYFAKINRLLKPGGLVMNHGITTNSLEDAELGGGIGEFVEEYVFPGGELVHVSEVMRGNVARGPGSVGLRVPASALREDPVALGRPAGAAARRSARIWSVRRGCVRGSSTWRARRTRSPRLDVDLSAARHEDAAGRRIHASA